MAKDPTPSSDMPHAERVARTVHSLLKPAVRLALRFGVGTKDIGEQLELALFRQARERGLKLAEVADALGVSMRKASRLSKQLKQNFLDPERDVELPRRIEFMLWGEPLGEGRIAQALPDESPEDVRAALEQLLDEGRVEAIAGRTTTYHVTHKDSRLVRDSWMARFDALGDLVGTVADAVVARFFHADERAFARTISFRVRREDLPKLRALYEEHVWPTVSALDGAATDAPDEDVETMGLSILWAPDEYADSDDGPPAPSE